jgi:bifunctional DNA-binding transcriptional regulator/antitoxin component of YhaV-PrlF toxin-antitoxin module
MDRNQAVAALTAELIESRLRASELFTTLDISNGLKLRRWPVRHSEVAKVVRSIWESGALQRFHYDRALIDVNTDNGSTMTQAFLYLPTNSHPDNYGNRIQDALPPVADDLARDLLTAPVPPTPLLLTPNRGTRTRRSGGTRSRVRQDGALPIPYRVVREAGWKVGDRLELHCRPEPAGMGTALVLSAASSTPDTVSITVRVWKDYRVRVCKTALRRVSAGDSLPALPLSAASWAVQGKTIQVPLAA